MANSYNNTELLVLKRLWAAGPSSVREVHDALAGETGWSPSTTRTMLSRMEEKGMVSRSEVHGVAVYRAVQSRVQVLGSIARELTREVFDIRGAVPASMFADSPHISEAELAELDAIINAANDAGEDGK